MSNSRRTTVAWILTAIWVGCWGTVGGTSAAVAQTLEERLIAESPASLAAEARRDGDALRGAAVFYSQLLACSTCHGVGDRPNTIGPDLTQPTPESNDVELVESVLLPSKRIAKEYATVAVVASDGRAVTGVIVEETDASLVLRDAAHPDQLVTFDKREIDVRQQAGQSIMPSGQINQLQRSQVLDLIRYLIELRDGGPARARQLQPPPDPLAQTIPDEPLPWRPVVQRGEVQVPGGGKYPHAVALGFVGGTAIFDALQLRTVAIWHDGFVKPTPQNYFGLDWHGVGTPVPQLADSPNPLRFLLPNQDGWQTPEPALTSDPNRGTRFDGYQIGSSSVRLHYRLRVGEHRIAVSEEVRVVASPDWQGLAREFRFSGIPAGGQVAWQLPASDPPVTGGPDPGAPSLLRYRAGQATIVARGQALPGGSWQPTTSADAGPAWRWGAAPSADQEPVTLTVELWKYRGRHPEPTATELAVLATATAFGQESWDLPRRAAAPLPPVAARDLPVRSSPTRPAVQPSENVDSFPATRGRFLRFVITATNDQAEPGLDELEIFGPGSDANLALQGTATASSVIAGYPIHQIAHLNDGKLGNDHSWISAEPGGGWAQIELSEPVEMDRIVWARDRRGVSGDRLVTSYRVEISTDGQSWTKVADEQGRASPGQFAGAIRRDATPGYAMEAIPGPFPTWRPSDVVFGDDGTMYAIAMTEGQIWRTRTPPPGHPERVQWHRYATGLYHPLGLAIVDGRPYVAQKQEITELIDNDGDGTVEHFRTVATGWGLSSGWHEYCFGLAVDPQKNLWFALNTGYFWTNPGYVNPGRWRGGILRVAHDTEMLEVMATGCRVPNGIAEGPEGELFFSDNQGDWIQACKLAHIVPGNFYGHPETTADALPPGDYPTGRSAVWLPYEHSRSVSGPVLDSTAGRFGPFAGQMFVGDVGYGANPGIMRVALEQVNGQYQGACFRFVTGQPHGCERMRMGPDGQLYQASLASGLTRIAFLGRTPLSIHSLQIRPGGTGFVIRLTRPLAVTTRLATDQFRVKRYHYLYTGDYGSPQADEAIIPVESAELAADRQSITLTFPVETYPIGMVYELNLGALESDEGERLEHNEAWYTVHEIPQ